MTDEEAQEFDASYSRAKKVLKRLNTVARQEYLRVLKEEEGPALLTTPNYSEAIAYRNGQRQVWNKLQELTRT